MPKSTPAEKAARKRARNKVRLSAVKTYIGKAEQLISGKKDMALAEAAVHQAISALDKVAQKGVLHHNNAARRKSRLMKKFSAAFPRSETSPEQRPPEGQS